MSEDFKKLRLVTDDSEGENGSSHASEPPPTPEEQRAAASLRDSLDDGDEPISNALRALYRQGQLDEDRHQALLSSAGLPSDLAESSLEGDDVEQTPEVAASRRAVAAVVGGDDAAGTGPADASLAALATMLRAAVAPTAIDDLRNQALIAKAFRQADAQRGESANDEALAPSVRSIRSLRRWVTGFAAVAAVAAGLIGLQLQSSRDQDSPAAAANLIGSRSTRDLFDSSQRFELEQTTARIDTIAQARTQDLRANRFAKWGVQ